MTNLDSLQPHVTTLWNGMQMISCFVMRWRRLTPFSDISMSSVLGQRESMFCITTKLLVVGVIGAEGLVLEPRTGLYRESLLAIISAKVSQNVATRD
eukprot:CAMPEP_0170200778 /NCGR_PEP_ID=MMETSP0040_2-20121228/70044_1 /TAXON_ID=641309 /ORGANISM="Lotharella oceanica, Strain CCMP622" /LENGTH=96 /DNA_ID=CAMNT_0010450969 /DNA_START=615 /DNA_END=902 /DNA_ORIENTATION=+